MIAPAETELRCITKLALFVNQALKRKGVRRLAWTLPCTKLSSEPADAPASLLDPDAIAATYLQILHQPRSAWTSEIALRPWVEKF